MANYTIINWCHMAKDMVYYIGRKTRTKAEKRRNMAFAFCSFASGSTGNSYLIKTDKTNILVDAGISGKRIVAGLESKGIEPQDLDAVLITHEHTDHIQSLRVMSKKAQQAELFASAGTFAKIAGDLPAERTQRVLPGETFFIGDIVVKPFHLSHDAAEPTGFSFVNGGKQITIVTDTGYVTDEIYEQIRCADLLVLEANHEVNILKMGTYPYNVKRRILGDYGHLSNEAAGECICRMLGDRKDRKMPKVILAHLSRENNTPKQAYLTIKNILLEEEFYIEKDLELDIITKDEISTLYEV